MKPKYHQQEDLTCIGNIVFKLWVTKDGKLLSEVKPVVLAKTDEVKTQIACITASIQDYIATGLAVDVEDKKQKLSRLFELTNQQPKIPENIIKWQKQLPGFEKQPD